MFSKSPHKGQDLSVPTGRENHRFFSGVHSNGVPHTPTFVVGIAGPSGSGKTTFANALASEIRRFCGDGSVAILSEDMYYHCHGALSMEERASVNYDEPKALDHDLLNKHVQALRKGDVVRAPVYDFKSHARHVDRTCEVSPTRFLIVEGILPFTHPALRASMDLRLFMGTDLQACYERRLARDVKERGRTPECVKAQWDATVKPMAEQHVLPTQQHAEIVVPEGGRNVKALNEVVAHLRHKADVVPDPQSESTGDETVHAPPSVLS